MPGEGQPLPPFLATCVLKAGHDPAQVVDWKYEPPDPTTTEPARLWVATAALPESIEIAVVVYERDRA